MADKEVLTHPVQLNGKHGGRVGTAVTLRAYEVYVHIYNPQEALITGDCRGGFSAGELIAYLYAHSFPQAEWRDRATEAFNRMEL